MDYPHGSPNTISFNRKIGTYDDLELPHTTPIFGHLHVDIFQY